MIQTAGRNMDALCLSVCTSGRVYVPCIFTCMPGGVTVGDSGPCCTCFTYFER